MNSLFAFAKGELSQDAFICWCVNWLNYKSAPLYPLAQKLLHAMGAKISSKTTLSIKQQFLHSDILLIIEKPSRLIIIEDKIYSSEHGGQIAAYKQSLQQQTALFSEKQLKNISTVYFKTGFFYDYDKKVAADHIINGEKFRDLLKPYQGISEILDSYLAALNERLKWYDDNGSYANIGRAQIAQYKLMRSFFPEQNYWQNKKSTLFEVRHGENKDGSPLTEIDILQKDGSISYTIFWRIDKYKRGKYISLRFYHRYNKKSAAEKARHQAACQAFRQQAAEILQSLPPNLPKGELSTKSTAPMEAALLDYLLPDAESDWNLIAAATQNAVRHITAKLRLM